MSGSTYSRLLLEFLRKMEICKYGITLVVTMTVLLFVIGTGECKQLSSNYQTRRIHSELNCMKLAKAFVNGFKELINGPDNSNHYQIFFKIVDASTRPLRIYV